MLAERLRVVAIDRGCTQQDLMREAIARELDGCAGCKNYSKILEELMDLYEIDCAEFADTSGFPELHRFIMQKLEERHNRASAPVAAQEIAVR